MYQEYKTIKNQLNYHLFPLKQMNNLNKSSWNRQMLDLEINRIGGKGTKDFGKTYLIDHNDLFQLPEINGQSDNQSKIL